MFSFWMDLCPMISNMFSYILVKHEIFHISIRFQFQLIFSRLSIGDSGIVKRFPWILDHHLGITEVCYWSRAMLLNFLVVGKTQIFFRQMQLRDISGDWLVKRQKWQQTIWLDRFCKGVQTTKENRSPRVCWKTACVYVVRETDELNNMAKTHFWLVKCCVVQQEISICHWFFKIEFIMLEIVWNISDVSHPDMKQFVRTTVDGRNPKQPPGMCKTLWIMGINCCRTSSINSIVF